MTQLQIGAELTQGYFAGLLRQLQRTAERYGLDTVETEELMQWASMAMESPSPSISALRETLITGLRELDSITSNPDREDGIISAVLQASPGVRYAAVIRKPGKPGRVIIYLGR